jgi:hypothetical protein
MVRRDHGEEGQKVERGSSSRVHQPNTLPTNGSHARVTG